MAQFNVQLTDELNRAVGVYRSLHGITKKNLVESALRDRIATDATVAAILADADSQTQAAA